MTSHQSNESLLPSNIIVKSIPFFMVFLIVLYFIPIFGFFKNLLWQPSTIVFFPRPFQIIIFGLSFVSIILLLFKPRLIMIKDNILFIFGFLFFILLTLLFQESIPLYGDGFLLQQDIETFIPGQPTEVLTVLIYRMVFTVLPNTIKSGYIAYHLINTITGLIAIYCYIQLTKTVEKEFRPFLLFIFIMLGINILFTGHVENYNLCYIFMLLYCIRFFLKKPSIYVQGLLLGFAICFHSLGIILLPSFIYYVFKEKIKKLVLLKTIILFTIPFFVTFLLGLLLRVPMHNLIKNILFGSIIGLKGYSGGFSFWSIFNIKHFLDIINIMLLTLPVWPILIITVFIRTSSILLNKSLIILMWISIPSFIIFVLFNSPLGLARDWDIGSLLVIWSILFIILQFFHCMKFIPDLKRYLMPICLLNFCLSIPWFIVNHYPELSIKKYESILVSNANLPSISYGYENLARYYKLINKHSYSAQNYELAAKYNPNIERYWSNAASEYLMNNTPDKAIFSYQKAIKINSKNPYNYAGIGLAFINMEMYDSAIVEWEQALLLDNANDNYRYYLSICYYNVGLYDRSMTLIKEILNHNPQDGPSYLVLIDNLIALKNYKKANELLNILEASSAPTTEIMVRRKKLNSIE